MNTTPSKLNTKTTFGVSSVLDICIHCRIFFYVFWLFSCPTPSRAPRLLSSHFQAAVSYTGKSYIGEYNCPITFKALVLLEIVYKMLYRPSVTQISQSAFPDITTGGQGVVKYL